MELVKLPPPRGDEERPEDELAEPVLALSKDEAEADEVAEDTPDEEPMPEKTCEKFSSPWSGASQRASAPLRESMEGVGDVISPDFCLTIASRTTPVNTDLVFYLPGGDSILIRSGDIKGPFCFINLVCC